MERWTAARHGGVFTPDAGARACGAL